MAVLGTELALGLPGTSLRRGTGTVMAAGACSQTLSGLIEFPLNYRHEGCMSTNADFWNAPELRWGCRRHLRPDSCALDAMPLAAKPVLAATLLSSRSLSDMLVGTCVSVAVLWRHKYFSLDSADVCLTIRACTAYCQDRQLCRENAYCLSLNVLVH